VCYNIKTSQGAIVDPSNEENKSWKQEGVFDTYEEADSTRAVMLSMNTDNKLLVKVKRCGPGGIRFKVKSWYPPEPKKNKKKRKKE